MKNLNRFHKLRSLMGRIRGFIVNIVFFGGKAQGLRVAKNVQLFGDIKLKRNIRIGSNVKVYKKATISDNVYIGDNVELRSNRGNLIIIGSNCTLNRGSIIMGQVIIKENCLIAPLCAIIGSNHVFSENSKLIREQGIVSKGIIIEENVWIGAQVTILDGVTIGKNSIIGAGAVVTKNIPKNSIAVGNPCRVVKFRI